MALANQAKLQFRLWQLCVAVAVAATLCGVARAIYEYGPIMALPVALVLLLLVAARARRLAETLWRRSQWARAGTGWCRYVPGLLGKITLAMLRLGGVVVVALGCMLAVALLWWVRCMCRICDGTLRRLAFRG